MCFVTKNDRVHGKRTYRDADAAAINWTEIRNNMIFGFMQDKGHGYETLGQYLERTGQLERYNTLSSF